MPLELPAILPFANPWETYRDAVYARFRADFIESKPLFRGKPVNIQYEPLEDGLPFTFWHVISEKGFGESERQINFRRCERIAWPRALLEAAETDRRVWAEIRPGLLGVALPDFSYVIFIRAWPHSFQLKTAYLVEDGWRQDKYRREWERAKR